MPLDPLQFSRIIVDRFWEGPRRILPPAQILFDLEVISLRRARASFIFDGDTVQSVFQNVVYEGLVGASRSKDKESGGSKTTYLQVSDGVEGDNYIVCATDVCWSAVEKSKARSNMITSGLAETADPAS